jgi:hypothetical protein
VRRALAVALWPIAAVCAAQPLSVASLERLLQSKPPGERRFEETRESPWLAAPLSSSGRMVVGTDRIEKRVEQPRAETWVILTDRMRVTRGNAARSEEVMLNRSEAMAVLAKALRCVLSANLTALEPDFVLAPSGDESTWTLLLTPRRQRVARHLRQIELQGTGERLNTILLIEAKGERTITRLMDP